MNTPTHPTGSTRQWPTDKLTALRLGQRLVTELPPSRPGRRAFVDITPLITAADTEARGQGWQRADHARTFTLQHWDYAADRLDGFDHDTEATLIKTATAIGEPDLTTTLEAWHLVTLPRSPGASRRGCRRRRIRGSRTHATPKPVVVVW